MADQEKTRFQQHTEEAKARKALMQTLEARRARAQARFRASINEQLKTRAGQDLLVGLFHLCAYNQTSVVSDPETGEVMSSATAYNDARRSVYVDLRKQMDPELRAKMEALAENGVEDEPKKEK